MWSSTANPNPRSEDKEELIKLIFEFHSGDVRRQVIKASRTQVFISEEKGLSVIAEALNKLDLAEEKYLPDGIFEDHPIIANYIYHCILHLPEAGVRAVQVLFVNTDLQFKVRCRWCTQRVVKQLHEDDDISSCPVCLEDMDDQVVYLYCKHGFHRDCVANWLDAKEGSASCPLCRLPFADIFDYLVVLDSDFDADDPED